MATWYIPNQDVAFGPSNQALTGTMEGIGDPNGRIDRLKGWIYFDMTTPSAPVQWVKTTDGGNTGWV